MGDIDGIIIIETSSIWSFVGQLPQLHDLPHSLDEIVNQGLVLQVAGVRVEGLEHQRTQDVVAAQQVPKHPVALVCHDHLVTLAAEFDVSQFEYGYFLLVVLVFKQL